MSVHEGPAGAREGGWPLGGILRDTTRGGIAGLIVGVLVAGIGGRVAMRLAAIAVPESTGAFTENGNRIGAITLSGSLGLVLLGLFLGLAAAVIWVTIRPWIPGGTATRALLAMPIALALGSFGLIQGENHDFAVLNRQPSVVVILVVLVMLIGAAVALADAWLDDRLPRVRSRGSVSAGVYALLTLVGLLLGLPLVVLTYFREDTRALGIPLVVVGIATMATWVLRIRGRDGTPPAVAVLGYGGLAVAVAIGLAATWSEIAFALQIR